MSQNSCNTWNVALVDFKCVLAKSVHIQQRLQPSCQSAGPKTGGLLVVSLTSPGEDFIRNKVRMLESLN
ncbi:hypothetical protein LDENG_00197460 [Lucifuga dentata]|nr:hypothetical protein LDENG_00197460 [Lucifuga dentata]